MNNTLKLWFYVVKETFLRTLINTYVFNAAKLLSCINYLIILVVKKLKFFNDLVYIL